MKRSISIFQRGLIIIIPPASAPPSTPTLPLRRILHLTLAVIPRAPRIPDMTPAPAPRPGSTIIGLWFQESAHFIAHLIDDAAAAASSTVPAPRIRHIQVARLVALVPFLEFAGSEGTDNESAHGGELVVSELVAQPGSGCAASGRGSEFLGAGLGPVAAGSFARAGGGGVVVIVGGVAARGTGAGFATVGASARGAVMVMAGSVPVRFEVVVCGSQGLRGGIVGGALLRYQRTVLVLGGVVIVVGAIFCRGWIVGWTVWVGHDVYWSELGGYDGSVGLGGRKPVKWKTKVWKRREMLYSW